MSLNNVGVLLSCNRIKITFDIFHKYKIKTIKHVSNFGSFEINEFLLNKVVREHKISNKTEAHKDQINN